MLIFYKKSKTGTVISQHALQ